ncbi:MAG: ABC transporter permease [Armatimonadetes bacterium]|nr:ABC transporter permease [Armatimonadota bacterium]
MTRYVARRLLQVPVPLLLISIVVFALVRITGDPAVLYLGQDATPEQIRTLQQQLGLDQPIWIQYVRYVRQAAQGDMGRSLRYRRPALAVVVERLPFTALLATTGLLLAALAGVVIGVVSTRYRGTWGDVFLVGLSVTGQAMPNFWLGVVLVLFFAVRLQWLPTSGAGEWRHLVLPSVTLASFIMPHMMLLTRTALLEVMQDQYVTVARAKGLPERRVLYRHALRNALNPVVAYVGLQFGNLMGGSVITEIIFAWPGVGQLTIQSIFNRDAPVVVAAVIILALIIVLCNLAADIANALVDPRIRIQA